MRPTWKSNFDFGRNNEGIIASARWATLAGTSRLLGAAALIGTVAVFPETAIAQRDVLYPGMMCRLRGDHLRAGHDEFLRVSQFGQIGNNTADGNADTSDIGDFDLNVVCPIPRHHPDSANGLTVNIRFKDPEVNTVTETRFCCQLHNGDPDGTHADFTDSSTCREAQSEEPTLPIFGDLVRELNTSNANGDLENWEAGVYMLHCTIPPGAFLIDYRVREN